MVKYSIIRSDVVDTLQPDIQELDSFATQNHLQGFCPQVIHDAWVSSLRIIDAIPIYVYGTLRRDCRAHSLIERNALPMIKTREGFFDGLALYHSKNPTVDFPAARLDSGHKTYCEVYLVTLEGLQALNNYEAAPDLYDLVPFCDGYVYVMKDKNMEMWEPDNGTDHDWVRDNTTLDKN